MASTGCGEREEIDLHKVHFIDISYVCDAFKRLRAERLVIYGFGKLLFSALIDVCLRLLVLSELRTFFPNLAVDSAECFRSNGR